MLLLQNARSKIEEKTTHTHTQTTKRTVCSSSSDGKNEINSQNDVMQKRSVGWLAGWTDGRSFVRLFDLLQCFHVFSLDFSFSFLFLIPIASLFFSLTGTRSVARSNNVSFSLCQMLLYWSPSLFLLVVFFLFCILVPLGL